MSKKKTLSLIIFLMVLLVACRPSHPAPSLSGTRWELTSLHSQPLVAGTAIQISFEPDLFSGHAGCNAFGGSFQTRAPDSFLANSIESTAMACETPAGAMEQESIFLKALMSAISFGIEADQLSLKDSLGETLLVFSRIQPVAQANLHSLEGTRWQLLSLNGKELIAGSQITMIFDPGLKVHGSAGCRHYEAAYIETETGIRFTGTSMLEPDCASQALLIQEGEFTDMLTWANSIAIDGDNLILSTMRGEVLVFNPLAD